MINIEKNLDINITNCSFIVIYKNKTHVSYFSFSLSRFIFLTYSNQREAMQMITCKLMQLKDFQ